MLKESHEKILLKFFGDSYDKELPRTDEGMFYLLLGVMIAKNSCKMTYRVTKLRFIGFPPNSSIHSVIKHEEKARMRLYDKTNELVSSYVAEVKGFRRKSKEFSEWYDEMHKRFNENEDAYTKKSKLEAGKIMNVVFKHLMSDLYNGS